MAITRECLAYCSACPVREIADVMRRLGMPFHQITGTLSSTSTAWNELDERLQAAAVVHALEHSRLGFVGHYYSGMLDIATDLVQVGGGFGIVIEMLEVYELSGLREHIDEARVEAELTHCESTLESTRSVPLPNSVAPITAAAPDDFLDVQPLLRT